MMAEYIDRLKVLKEMHCSHTLPFFIGHRTDEDIMFCQMLDIVTEQPTADVVEVKHGKWIYKGIADMCSVCGRWLVIEQASADLNYCPHCGAKMDGGSHG